MGIDADDLNRENREGEAPAELSYLIDD